MRVATYNVHRCRGPAGRFRPDRITAVIAEIRPDVIALQEAQHYLRRGRGMLDAEALERDLNLRVLPVTGRAGEQGWRSNLLLVRRDARVLRPPIALRLGGLEPRGAIMTELDLGGGPFRVIATHLSLSVARRRAQARLLLDAMAQAEEPAMPTILLGDLNEWRRKESALDILAPTFGTPPRVPTFPAFRPVLSLDRILAVPHGLVSGIAAHDTALSRVASDHLPLTAEIQDLLLPPPERTCSG